MYKRQLEALVSTAIVGIGFVAIFSMVNFSVQSIDSSAERTKANYLVSMIAEDIIGHRNTIHGVNMDAENIDWAQFKGKRVLIRGCANAIVPTWAFLILTAHLAEYVERIYFGELRSAVKIFVKGTSLT